MGSYLSSTDHQQKAMLDEIGYVANDYQQEYENLIALAARDGKIRNCSRN